MTAPELHRARQWSAALAATLDEVVDQVGVAARRLADAWPDAHGAEWAERLHVLRRALQRDADAATELGRAVDRLADDAEGAPSGPRLGGTGTRRVDDRRGVTIPRLDDPADDPG